MIEINASFSTNKRTPSTQRVILPLLAILVCLSGSVVDSFMSQTTIGSASSSKTSMLVRRAMHSADGHQGVEEGGLVGGVAGGGIGGDGIGGDSAPFTVHSRASSQVPSTTALSAIEATNSGGGGVFGGWGDMRLPLGRYNKNRISNNEKNEGGRDGVRQLGEGGDKAAKKKVNPNLLTIEEEVRAGGWTK